MSIWIFFRLIGALALLMFGMKTMSDSLQKMAGPQLRHVLGTMTTNRVTGILSGTLITAAVQSSTATTVMTVSFVNAGLLTLAQAISVIMGANIGTTLTAWIMSAGFSFNITDFVWPAFFLAIILIYSKKRKIVGDFIFGISFMFLGLELSDKPVSIWTWHTTSPSSISSHVLIHTALRQPSPSCLSVACSPCVYRVRQPSWPSQ